MVVAGEDEDSLEKHNREPASNNALDRDGGWAMPQSEQVPFVPGFHCEPAAPAGQEHSLPSSVEASDLFQAGRAHLQNSQEEQAPLCPDQEAGAR